MASADSPARQTANPKPRPNPHESQSQAPSPTKPKAKPQAPSDGSHGSDESDPKPTTDRLHPGAEPQTKSERISVARCNRSEDCGPAPSWSRNPPFNLSKTKKDDTRRKTRRLHRCSAIAFPTLRSPKFSSSELRKIAYHIDLHGFNSITTESRPRKNRAFGKFWP